MARNWFEKVGKRLGQATGLVGPDEFSPSNFDYEAYKKQYAGMKSDLELDPNDPRFKLDITKQQETLKGLQRSNIEQNMALGTAQIASQRGVNPALATMMAGNQSAQMLGGASAQFASDLANQEMAANQFNIGTQTQLGIFNKGNYQQMLQNAMGMQQKSDMMNYQAQQQSNQALLNTIAAGAGAGMNIMGVGKNTSSGGNQFMADAPRQGLNLMQLAPLMTLSDKRAKEPVEEWHQSKNYHDYMNDMYDDNLGDDFYDSMVPKADTGQVQKFLETLDPYVYAYKKDSGNYEGGKPRMGVMAQNVEKSKAGKKAVFEDENGMKNIDYGQLSNMLAAGLGNLNQRLDKIEGRKNARK